jgi:hypothetical protein
MQILNLTPNACQCIIYLMFIPQLVLYLVPQIYKLLLHVLCDYLYILVLNLGVFTVHYVEKILSEVV